MQTARTKWNESDISIELIQITFDHAFWWPCPCKFGLLFSILWELKWRVESLNIIGARGPDLMAVKKSDFGDINIIDCNKIKVKLPILCGDYIPKINGTVTNPTGLYSQNQCMVLWLFLWVGKPSKDIRRRRNSYLCRGP